VHSALTLRTKRSANAFALGVRGGVLTTSTPSAVNTPSKDPVNLASRSRIRNRNDAVRSPRSITKVSGLLSDPRAGWVGGDAEDVHVPGGDLHDEQHVQPAQGDGVDVKEVGREQPGRLRPQKRAPTRIDITRRGTDPTGAEDAANGASADLVAEADQFSFGCGGGPSPGSPGPGE